jgi:hypothetical protein
MVRAVGFTSQQARMKDPARPGTDSSLRFVIVKRIVSPTLAAAHHRRREGQEPESVPGPSPLPQGRKVCGRFHPFLPQRRIPGGEQA